MSKDALHIQIRENRQIMRGLNPNSPIYKRLFLENTELGAKLSQLKDPTKKIINENTPYIR